MFFQHNSALGPPYRVIVDTNFINFSLQNKIELVQGMMDCLYAKSACQLTSDSMHHHLRPERAGEARAEIPHGLARRARSAFRAP
jgi:rRNA-processing protein FCF1